TAWLQAAPAAELGDWSILRVIAESCTADDEVRSRGAAQLIAYFAQHERLPVSGFEEPAGRLVLFEAVRLADAANWDACRNVLPVLLRACTDHRSTFWLLGRRARDAGSEAGRVFLQQVVIPELLRDHALADSERVQLLRRIYEIEYTGP